jgi:hypothetical protein
MTPQLEEYKKAVEMLAQTKSPYTFSNQDSKHAAIVTEAILDFSEKEVCIYDNDLNLCGDASDTLEKFMPALERFASRGRILKLVIKNEYSTGNPISKKLYELSTKYPQNILIKKACSRLVANLENVGEELTDIKHINFAVGDKRSFRLEFPAGSRTAFCSFNNQAYSERLANTFNAGFDNCDNYFATQT